MTSINVDHVGIDAAGQGVQTAATKAGGALSDFQTALAAHGEPWGHEVNDPIGPLIGLCYTTIAGVAMACYTSNVKKMGGDGDSMRDTAANYRASEEAGVANARELLR